MRFPTPAHWAAVAGLALTGLALELALALGWVRAFPLFDRPGWPGPGDPIAWFLGSDAAGVNHFLLLLLAVFVPYLAAVALANGARGRVAVGIAVAGSVLFGVTALGLFPAGASDIFYNIVEGRMIWVHHLNPLVVPPAGINQDPLFPYLDHWQQTPSVYGPLWSLLTAPATLFGDSGFGGNSPLINNILAYKALPLAFELASLALVALIVARIERSRIAAAVVSLGWNPLLLWEIAGNGHNDIVMMSLVLLALLLLTGRRWPLAFPALVASALVKYVSLVLLPVFLIWILLRYGRSALLPAGGGLLLGVAVAAATYVPFWDGPRTFAVLLAKQNQLIFSPASAVFGTWGENLPGSSALVHVERGFALAFLLLYGLILLRLRPEVRALIRCCVETTFLVLVLLTWWFWPWYVLWGLALAALLPGGAHLRVFILFSLTAMLIYVSSSWRLLIWNFQTGYAMAMGTALMVFSAPVLYAVTQMLATGAGWWPPPSDAKRCSSGGQRSRADRHPAGDGVDAGESGPARRDGDALVR